jgi:dolichyl-phosphate-mannose-protein mannosyltransferase
VSGQPLPGAGALLEHQPGGAVAEHAPRASRGPVAQRPGPSLATIGLICVLTLQAVLSLRLVWSNTAFLDEATYLYAGHVEIAHLLTGTPVPAYSTYLSGAPVIYPPLAALASDLGGLAAARILSLGFMLGATSFLWATTTRLAGRPAAFFAAALFATVGSTQYLGAFATFDAMSLFLLAAAAWAAVAAGQRDEPGAWVLGAAAMLVLANATKYASALFDPVVAGLLLTTIAERRGPKQAFSRGGYFIVAVTSTLGLLLTIAGSRYLTGVMSTTLARAAGQSPPLVVVTDSVRWIGIVAALALVAAITAPMRSRGDRVAAIRLAVLAAAGVLVTANQARIHTTTSLSKHVDFGAWFAAVAAGYLLARLLRASRRRSARALAGAGVCCALVPSGFIGRAQGAAFFQEWPNTTLVTKILGPLTRVHPGNYLAEDYDVPAYYLQGEIPWQRWSNTWYFTYTPRGSTRQLVGVPAWRAAVLDHYFSLVVLDFGDTAGVDSIVTKAIHQSGDYHVIAEAPYWDSFGVGQFTVWAYQPKAGPGSRPASSPAAARGR